MNLKRLLIVAGVFSVSSTLWAKDLTEQQVKAVIDQQFKPLLAQYNIPGLAVAVTLNGQHYFVNYGVASKQSQQPVRNREIVFFRSPCEVFS